MIPPKELPPGAILTVAQIAAYLGVSDQTVYDLLELGEIPAKRVGRQWRIRREKFLAWLDSDSNRADLSPA